MNKKTVYWYKKTEDVIEVTFEERKIEEEHGVSVSSVHDVPSILTLVLRA